MKAKKIPYNLLLGALTGGASIILGFLSFSGMFALWPILPLAFGSFALAVLYEGEVYLQNIRQALNKLFFKRNYLENQLAETFLQTQCLTDKTEEGYPQFFIDYEEQEALLHAFCHKQLSDEDQVKKEHIEKKIRRMKKWFAMQLFAGETGQDDTLTDYERTLREWLKQHGRAEQQQKLLQRSRILFNVAKVFSLLAALVMGFATTYLLVEAFSVIPLFAAISFGLWPAIIIPMALIAGVAYGFLIYNAITAMIADNTLRKFYDKLKGYLKNGVTVSSVLLLVASVLLAALTVVMIICTAGTWWTIMRNAQPLFNWFSKIPGVVIGIVNGIITLSGAVFNIINTITTVNNIDDASQRGSLWERIKTFFVDGFLQLKRRENVWQMINPFRIVLTLIMTPSRVLLFGGHLASIGVTTDRAPGFPKEVVASLGILDEIGPDLHYFEFTDGGGHGHDHAHDHDHNADLPTRLLKFIMLPFYLLATTWDYFASGRTLSFKEAWTKQTGQETEPVVLERDMPLSSQGWQLQQSITTVEKLLKKESNPGSGEALRLIALRDELRQQGRGLKSPTEPKKSEQQSLEDPKARGLIAQNPNAIFASKEGGGNDGLANPVALYAINS